MLWHGVCRWAHGIQIVTRSNDIRNSMMSYERLWGKQTPGCVVLLVDQSVRWQNE